jgi:hypothetical protein
MTISPPHRAHALRFIGSGKTDSLSGFPVIAMGISNTDDETISHSLLPSRRSVFTPARQSHAHSLKEPGHQCTSQKSHCKQKDDAHIHDALLSTVDNGNSPRQSLQFAKETGPSNTRGPVCLSGRRRAEFSVTWTQHEPDPWQSIVSSPIPCRAMGEIRVEWRPPMVLIASTPCSLQSHGSHGCAAV